MTVAIAPRDPLQTLDGLVEVLRRLRDDLGVSVVFAPHDDLADWNGDTKTLTVDSLSPTVDKAWVLLQAWALFALGTHASEGHEQTRRLRSV